MCAASDKVECTVCPAAYGLNSAVLTLKFSAAAALYMHGQFVVLLLLYYHLICIPTGEFPNVPKTKGYTTYIQQRA